MATKGSWSTSSTATLLVPHNYYRAKLVIQCDALTGPVTIGFGPDVVYADGIQLLAAGSVIAIAGELARRPVYGVCSGEFVASGGYQENLGICS